jgi:hypothetical protein
MKDPGETLGDETRSREYKGRFISFIIQGDERESQTHPGKYQEGR